MSNERGTTELGPQAVAARRLGKLALALVLAWVLALPVLHPEIGTAILPLIDPDLLIFLTFIGGSVMALPVAFTTLLAASQPVQHQHRHSFARNLRVMGIAVLVLLALWTLPFTGNMLLLGGNNIVPAVVALSILFTLIAVLSLTGFIHTRWQHIPPDARPGAKLAIASIVLSATTPILFVVLVLNF